MQNLPPLADFAFRQHINHIIFMEILMLYLHESHKIRAKHVLITLIT